ncbi:MAG TPA: ABC transporter ATP-binding protein, partial [Desulfobacteraceae bacterium]|nr:ABC transporter ATP-binding protein [Desulfobacteraceae bacterium]
YYENPQYFDTLHRAQQEGPFRPTHIVNGLAQFGQNGISLIAMAGLLLSFHWSVTVVLFIAVIPGILVRIKYSGKMYRWQREKTQAERKASYFNWILTGDAHAKEIRLFGLGDLFIQQFSSLRKQLRRERIELTRKRSVADFMAQIGATVAVFGAFGFIAYRTVMGGITLGDMVMYFQAFQRGLGFLKEMLGALAGLYEDNLFLSNLFEFLDLSPRVKDPIQPDAVPKPMQKGLNVESVDFQYPAATRKALEGVSLSIDPGQVVALVGENGSGKTTLVKLLCRLYDPIAGRITMDDIDLRRFEKAALHREISVIFQDYAKYHLTARENIWLGNVETPSDPAGIARAAKRAGAHDLISGLPKGYETVLGRWFEEGSELSIGEWQKIALARAFMRPAQLIVLDEPTSSMDAKTEYEIFTRFKELLQGRAAVIISHRFSTVRMADRIIVLDQGRITESGSHEELMAANGTYAVMYERQAGYYR